MDLTGKLFVYNGTYSSKYNMRILHVDTEQIKQACGEVVYNSTFHRGLHRKIYTGRTWDESPLEFDIEFMSVRPIKKKHQREIENWLFNTNGFKKLYIDKLEDEDIEMWYKEPKQQYIECVFKSPEVIEAADGIYGWKAVCEMSTPMALQDKITVLSEDINSNTVSLPLRADSDINDYILPTVLFKISNTGSDANITIVNKDDDDKVISQMSITRIPVNATIQINSAIGTIVSATTIGGNGLPHSYYSNLEDKQFLKLISGSNNITAVCDGNNFVDFSIEWQHARWFR